MKPEHSRVPINAQYLEAGLETKAFTIAEVRGEPFIKDDQPVACPDTRGIWLTRAFT